MTDATASGDAALFGLDGFVVLATCEIDGELELLVQTTAERVGCPGCGAVARAKDRRPSWVAGPAAGRSCRGAVLVEANLVLPARVV